MKIFDVEIRVENDGKVDTTTERVNLATSLNEMTFKQLIDFHVIERDRHEWINEFAHMNPEQQKIESEKWDNQRQIEYYQYLTKIVNNFTQNRNMKAVLEFNLSPQPGSDLPVLQILAGEILENIHTNQPKEISGFTHKGLTFTVPQTEVIKIKELQQKLVGSKIKVGEAIEALQRSHIFNGSSMDDKRYYSDLAIVASVCRVVDENGVVESLPGGFDAFGNFVNERMDFLSDLPADVAIDVGFFLLNSLTRSMNMDMSNWHFSHQSNQATQKNQPSE